MIYDISATKAPAHPTGSSEAGMTWAELLPIVGSTIAQWGGTLQPRGGSEREPRSCFLPHPAAGRMNSSVLEP